MSLAIMVKSSSLPLLLAPLIGLLWISYRNRRSIIYYSRVVARSKELPVIMLILVSFCIWMLRGLLISGCIAYPLSLGCLTKLSWTVGYDVARNDVAWIMSWARQPNVPPDVVLANWDWLSAWLSRNRHWLIYEYGFVLLLVGILLWPIARRNRSIQIEWQVYALPAIVAFVGLLFWFFTAPDPRFGEGYLRALYLLPAIPGIYRFYMPHESLVRNISRYAAIALSLLILLYSHPQNVIGRMASRDFLLRQPTIPIANVKEIWTDTGVRILIPIEGDQCWNADLPCTPYYSPELRIINDRNGRIQEFRRHRS